MYSRLSPNEDIAGVAGEISSYAGFTKNGGTITGYTSDQNNGNVVRDDDDYIMGRRGHAVYVSETLRKETTARAQDNMSYRGTRGTTGAWDN